jgi:hypothetical protein
MLNAILAIYLKCELGWSYTKIIVFAVAFWLILAMVLGILKLLFPDD